MKRNKWILGMDNIQITQLSKDSTSDARLHMIASMSLYGTGGEQP